MGTCGRNNEEGEGEGQRRGSSPMTEGSQSLQVVNLCRQLFIAGCCLLQAIVSCYLT